MKWVLLRAVEEARAPLGLKATSLTLLRAMISFVRTDAISAERDDTHICFASNAALAERAHVSVQTIERHIGKLVSLGLIDRRASGNGKRWARRDGQGRVVLATGLSLLPLVRRHAELLGLAEQHAELRREIALLRDKCLVALASLRETCTPCQRITDLIQRAGTLLRRKADKPVLHALLGDICEELSLDNSGNTVNLRDTSRENEGHKETDLNPSVKEETQTDLDVSPEEMEVSYPKLCKELRFARSQSECTRIMESLAKQLHLGKIWIEVRTQGPALSFMILGYMLEKAQDLRNPQAYARTLLRGLEQGTVDARSLLASRRVQGRRREV